MKKFLGTILTVAGACIFGFFYLLTAYYVYFNSDVPGIYTFMYGAICLAGAAMAIWGRRLYKAGWEGPKAQRFDGVLLCLIGAALIAAALFWAVLSLDEYREACYMEIPAAIILAVLGAGVIFLGARMCRRAGADRAYQDRTATKKSEPVPPPPPPKPAEPTAAVCPDCGRRYPLDKVYCEECGALLEKK